MNKKPGFFLFLFSLTLQVYSQQFYVNQFRAADGLQTDMIKCVAQDSYGFIWIGTDDGLIKYDGVNFHKYPDATSSTYIKDFLKTSDDKLLAIHDLGVTEIINELDTVRFESFLQGKRSKTDTTIWYPKQGYEDQKGNIWFSEPQSVIKYHISSERWERYKFGPEDNSISFIRSFHFHQLNSDSLLITSYPGNFFIYQYGENTISELQISPSTTEIFFVKKVNGNLLVGTSDNLYRLDEQKFKMERISNVPTIYSDAVSLDDSTFLLCSESDQNFIFTRNNKGFSQTPILNTLGRANEAFVSEDETIWLATDVGVLLLNTPQLASLNVPSVYLEGVVHSEENDLIYGLVKEQVWKINETTREVDLLLTEKNGYFLSGTAFDGELWVSNAYELWRIRGEKVLEKVDFQDYGRFIFTVHKDDENNLWISQEASLGVKKFDPETGEIKVYNESDSLPVIISEVDHNDKGIFAAAADPDRYLYFKGKNDRFFQQISHPISGPYRDGFSIEDIEIDDSVIWMATNKGLFKHTSEKVEKITFNSSFDNTMIRTLAMDSVFLWFGNTLGLFRYNTITGDYAYFNEKTGLPVNSVNEEGILITDEAIWVGTSYGMGVLDEVNSSYEKTSSPVILGLMVDGEERFTVSETPTLPNKPFIDISFASLSFPSDEIEYSYRIPEVSEYWSKPSNSKMAKFSELSTGKYTFQVKAKKLGSYDWSDITEYTFFISPSFYSSTSFYLIAFSFLLVLVIITRYITRYFMKKREEYLKGIVRERTQELNQYKENLEKLVDERTKELQNTLMKLQDTQNHLIQAEKMASLGVLTAGVAHEINNPMNYIQGGLYSIESIFKHKQNYSSEEEMNEDLNEVMKNMQFGMDRIINITASLSRFSRRSTPDRTLCNIHDIIDNCLLILNHEIKGKCEIIKEFTNKDASLMADEGNLHQLFSNLISNAVHAIEEEGEIKITTYFTCDGKNLEIVISDTGKGIPGKNIQRIFDPFFTTKAPGVGTGLGLFISHKIVDEHNGSIKFSSQEGKGTDVFIKFPI